MKNLRLLAYLIIAFILTACDVSREGEELIVARLKAQLEKQKLLLDTPEERANVTLIDFESGYSYSEEKGLHRLMLHKPDTNGIVTLSDGHKIRVPNEAVDAASIQPLATYEPYRRIISTANYSRIHGYITLPTSANVTGVTELTYGSEAAYNYFGLKRTGIDAETGLFFAAWRPGGFSIYHSFVINGAHYWLEEPTSGWKNCATGASIPTGSPIPFGTKVFIKTYVSADGNLNAYYAYSGKCRTYTYTGLATKLNGFGQSVRRVTSLLLNSSGKSVGNKWESVQVGTSSTNLVNLTASNTNSVYPTSQTSQIKFTTTNAYYNETVSLYAP